jgi:hypothetical protein
MSRTFAFLLAGTAVVALLVAGLALALRNDKSSAPQIVTTTVSHNVKRAPAAPNRPAAQPSPAADESDPTGADRSDARSDDQAGDNEGRDNEGSDNQAGDNRGGGQP